MSNAGLKLFLTAIPDKKIVALEIHLQQHIEELHHSLGIGGDYILNSRLPVCPEPVELVDTELDFLQRPQQMTSPAFAAWTKMKSQASVEGITLFLISAFRSMQYQHDLIARKLEGGQEIEDILKVNAAPGFSEHHSGRAIDIGTSGCEPLVQEFENTDAFQWLKDNSRAFSFALSYPRNNRHGIDYEPWHWCFQHEQDI